MENKEDDFNRPITMDDVVTPISKKPIEQIDAELWPDMDIGELWDQKTFLQTRHNSLVAASGHPAIIAQMQIGLDNLDAIIAHKTPEYTGNSNGTGLL